VADAVSVNLRAEPLRDHVDVVVLEVLGDARDERHADCGEQQQADAAEELSGRVLGEPGRVLVDDVPEDQGIEQREHLVDRREHQRKNNQSPVILQIRGQKLHVSPSVHRRLTAAAL